MTSRATRDSGPRSPASKGGAVRGHLPNGDISPSYHNGDPRQRDRDPRQRDGDPRQRDGDPRHRDGDPRQRDGDPRQRDMDPRQRDHYGIENLPDSFDDQMRFDDDDINYDDMPPQYEESAPLPEFTIGDLHCVYLSEMEIKYTNTKHKAPPGGQDDKSCDLQVKTANRTYQAHKSMLKEVSGYFEKALETGRKSVVDLPKDMKDKEFSMLLDIIYDGSMLCNPENAFAIFDVAETLSVNWVRDASSNYLLRNVRPDNYMDIKILFEKHKYDILAKHLKTVVANHLVAFSEDTDFLLNLELDFLLEILSNNYYIEGSEGFVVKVVLDWVHVKKEERNSKLSALLKQIRFPLLEPEELVTLPLEVQKVPGLSTKIEASTDYCMNVGKQPMYTDNEYLSRGSRNVVMFVSASEFNNGNIMMYKDLACPEEHMVVEQLQFNGLMTNLAFMSMAPINNFLYAAGGYTDEHSSSTRMFRYDPRFREWLELAPMLKPRVSFAMCSTDKNLYAVGGINRIMEAEEESEHILSSCEVYDPIENGWKELPALPVGVSESAAACWDEVLYASGGVSADHNDPIPLDYVYALKVRRGDKWDQITPMLTGRQGHSMSAINGKLFIVGGKFSYGMAGFEQCLSNEMYDIATRQWTKLTPLVREIGNMSRFAAVIDGKVVFLAGQKWHYYDTEKDELIEGEYTGPEIHRCVAMKIAYPPNA